MTVTEYECKFKPIKDTIYLALTGELWGVFWGDSGENRPRYNGTELYKGFVISNPLHNRITMGDRYYPDIFHITPSCQGQILLIIKHKSIFNKLKSHNSQWQIFHLPGTNITWLDKLKSELYFDMWENCCKYICREQPLSNLNSRAPGPLVKWPVWFKSFLRWIASWQSLYLTIQPEMYLNKLFWAETSHLTSARLDKWWKVNISLWKYYNAE